jgi:hypothetical protein
MIASSTTGESVTMHDHDNANPNGLKRVPWNKGKLIGAKPPLRPKHVWSIRTKLQMQERLRDFRQVRVDGTDAKRSMII